MFKNIHYADKNVKLSAYDTNLEKEILLYSITADELRIGEVFDLVKSCVHTDSLVPFTHKEKKMILMMLRQISVDDTFTLKVKCNGCGKKYEPTLEFKDILQPGSLRPFKGFTFKDAIEGDLEDYVVEDIENVDVLLYDEIEEYVEANKTRINLSVMNPCHYCKHENLIELNDKELINTMSDDTVESLYRTMSVLVFYGKYTKADVDGMLPFERNIFLGLLNKELEKK